MTGASRRQRIQALLFAAIMVVSMVAAGVGGLAGSAAGLNESTLVVDDDFSEPDNSTNFSSIQDAVDEAAENDSIDTIKVRAGSYDSVMVNVDGLTLEGPNADTPGSSSDRGDEATITADSDSPVVFKADNVEVSGFEIRDDGNDIDNLVYLDGPVDTTATIENNVIQGANRTNPNEGTGAYLADAGDENVEVTISNNLFKNNFAAVGGTEKTDINVTGNTFEGNTEGIGLGPGYKFVDSVDSIDALIEANAFDGSNTYAVGDYTGDLSPTKYTASGGVLVQSGESISSTIDSIGSDRTIVLDGEFGQDVTIDQNGVSIVGTSSGAIQGQGGSQGTITVSENNVSISNLNVSAGTGQAAVTVLSDTEGLELTDSRIVPAQEELAPGILFQGGVSDSNVARNVFVTPSTAARPAYVNGETSVGQPSSNVNFINNTFTSGSVGGGIVLGIEATDSTVAQNDFNATSRYGQLEIFGEDVEVENNSFAATDGFQIRDDGDSIDQEVIESNEFERAALVDGPADGSQGVYGSLSTAVENAAKDTTIVLAPGTYNRADINTDNITIEGPNADTPAHERDATDLSGEAVINTPNGPGIEVSNSANVTIDGVAFDGNEYFIESTDWENLAVEDTIFTNGQSKTGGHIWLKSSSGEFRFENNYLTGNNPSNGIRLKNGDSSRIGVSIKNNVWENNHAWAMNLNHAQGVVENNTVRNTEQFDPESEYEDYKQWGVLLAASNNDVRVANNTFESLTGPSVDLYGNFDGKIAISQNTFANTTVDSGSVEISDTQLDNDGFQPTFGDISISRNMFVDNNVSLKNEVDADIDARYNYFSDAPTVEGNVIYDPVLTAPVEDVADSTSDIRQYGSYLEISSDDGSPIAVGFAAPPDGNASEVLGDVVDVPSTVYRYNNTADEFVSIDGSYTPLTGEVLVIAPQKTLNDETIIPIATGSETAAKPDSVDLTQGWNLVATGATNDPSGIAVADGGADGVINDASLQVQPAQPGAPSANTGAFEGTWLFVDADGQLFTGYTEDQSPSTYSEEVLEPDTDKTE